MVYKARFQVYPHLRCLTIVCDFQEWKFRINPLANKFVTLLATGCTLHRTQPAKCRGALPCGDRGTRQNDRSYSPCRGQRNCANIVHRKLKLSADRSPVFADSDSASTVSKWPTHEVALDRMDEQYREIECGDVNEG